MMDLLNSVLRPILVFFFKSVYSRSPFYRKILWFFAKDYFVDGQEACRKILDELVGKGYGALLNYCSEDAEDLSDILRYRDVYDGFMQEAAKRNDNQNPLISLSIKMSQFGCFAQDLSLRREGRKILEETIAHAAQVGVRVVLDAERLDHAREVVLFGLEMRKKYLNTVVRLQAYNPDFPILVHRIINGKILANSQRGLLSLCICKGAYHEARALSSSETEASFLTGFLYCYRRARLVSADTNDVALIRKIRAAILEEGILPLQFSVGMLYNVRPWFARNLKTSGANVALYLPVIHCDEKGLQDTHWEGFAIRRLVEKPLYIFLPLRDWWTKVLKCEAY